MSNTIRMLSYELQQELGIKTNSDVSFCWLSIPVGFEICPIFPFGGAVFRFLIRKTGSHKSISVYFDGNDCLGFEGKPYYEAYSINGDTARFFVGEEKHMMEAIVKELQEEWRN